jgi:hypothetical protein
MFLENYRDAPPSPGNRWFVVTPASDSETVLDCFEAPDWGPAILLYAERLWARAYAVHVSLRPARPAELDRDGHSGPISASRL